MKYVHSYSDPTLALGAESMRAFLRTEIANFPNYLNFQALLAGLDSARHFSKHMVAARNCRDNGALAATVAAQCLPGEGGGCAVAGEVDPAQARKLAASCPAGGRLLLVGRNAPATAAEIRRRLPAAPVAALHSAPAEGPDALAERLVAEMKGDPLALLHLGAADVLLLQAFAGPLIQSSGKRVLVHVDRYFNFAGWREPGQPHAVIEDVVSRGEWRRRYVAFASADTGALLLLERD